MILRQRQQPPPMSHSAIYYLSILLNLTLLTCGFHNFVPFSSRHRARRIHHHIVLFEERGSSKGYKFGDFTKGLIKKATSGFNDITGENEYKFGDLSRWADSRIKDRINNITGKDEYQFGDWSRWADSQVKAKLTNLYRNGRVCCG